MTPERWAEVGRLFDAAQELAPEKRQGFLDGQCNGDSELKAEIESLLSSLDRAESFLEGPVAGSLQPEVARRHAGPYELLEEVGRGGMGVVHRAVRRDQGFERFVALKLVKRGMDTDFILRRFESERRILAGLDNPNIARVLDGGSTEDGLPYFVMELIEGQDLLDYCRGRRLGVSERLGLFRQICAAVQYAHQRLVIHRDIKPSNILVTADGVPKLLDFGLAKVLARDAGEVQERTQTALRVLTPEYASPEQIRGEPLTTASDVYSLGVVLYELLTGERPYRLKTRTPEEVSDAVLRQEPARPSTRFRLHRDLDAIVMMALRKEPSRRYASAEQLSEDIRRHLEGLPVKATPDSFAYRAGKFIRRHRPGVAAGILVAASLVGGLGISLWQMRVARSERNRARLEARKAQVEAARAQQVSVFLRSLFESSYPRRAQGEKVTAQDLLDAGAARVDRELAQQPDLQASMLALLGSVYLELNLVDKAEPLLTRSLALREKLMGKESAEAAESLYWLGRLKNARADYKAALALTERAVGIRESTGESPALAEALSQLGATLKNLGRPGEGRPLLQRAVAIEEKAGGANLHKWLSNLAAIEIDLGNYDAARKLLERALDIGVRAEGKVGVQVDVTMLNLASVLREQEDYARAISLFEQALAIDEKVYGNASGAVCYDLGELGELYFERGDYKRAHEYLDRSLEGGERALGPDHLGLAAPLIYSGRLRLAEGKPRESLLLFERALALLRKALPEDHDNIAEALTDIGIARVGIEGPAAAEPILRHALDIRRRVLAPGHPNFISTLMALSRALRDQGRNAEARPLLEEAVAIARAKLPERHSKRREAEEALRAAQTTTSSSASLR
jgi:serine/threonine-protein kinase